MRYLLLVGFVFLLFIEKANAQAASYAEAGFMYASLKKSGDYQSARIPGFSVGVAGLEFTLYAGQFTSKAFPDSAQLNLNGGFWNIGYVWRSKPRENLKRFHYTTGFGIGGYGIGEENGIQLNLRPGIQVNLTRSISLAASCYTGWNMFGKMRQDGGMLYTNDLYKCTKGFFALPSVTLRLNTNPMQVMGDSYSRSSYWGGGMVTHESYDVAANTKTTTKYYLPAGEYVTDAIITSNNYLNVFPKFVVGSRKNNKGPSVAGGAGVALRAGILALDLEYLQGKIGFHGPDGYGSNMDYWKFKRASLGMGINFFNIPFPFRGPSLIRVIFGARVGWESLVNNKVFVSNPYFPSVDPNPNLKGKFWSPFWAVEFGTLGVHMEIINNKQTGYGSGLLLGATYLVPLQFGK